MRPPLAERMRPQTLDEVLGQDEIVGPASPLRVLVQRGELPSMLLWGPPGSGKTTIARLLAHDVGAAFEELSAVSAGTADVRRIVKEAQERGKLTQQKTVLFLDEIHRFNKAQQDGLLPAVEKGIITLIGATTENPSFEVNPALRSRARVYVINPLTDEAVRSLLERAMHDAERGLGGTGAVIERKAFGELIALSQGDVRQALNALELAFLSAPSDVQGKRRVTVKHVRSALQRAQFVYDKNGEEHYNVISALHKSMRGSDANASLYWLGRMLEAGEDPLYVARRLVRFASEDVGMADPQALLHTVAAYQAAHMIGMPECTVILSQAVVYLALAPKSNALYTAYAAVSKDIHAKPQVPVPLHLRNAPTTLMKDLGYGKEYVYTPDDPIVAQTFLPEELQGKQYWRRLGGASSSPKVE